MNERRTNVAEVHRMEFGPYCVNGSSREMHNCGEALVMLRQRLTLTD